MVPQSYLKRFAEKNANNNEYHIGVRNKGRAGIQLFIQAVNNIAYVDNYYDVSTREDSKYWERFFSSNIEPFYGEPLNSIISKITLQMLDQSIISPDDKLLLSRIICFQLMRVPAFLDEYIEKGKNHGKEVLKHLCELFPGMLPEGFSKECSDSYIKGLSKDITLGAISDEKWLTEFSGVLAARPWCIYFNNTGIPFVTSDNPVLMLNLASRSFEYEISGIYRNDNILFFPLSSKVMIQLFPNGIIGDSVRELDRRRIQLRDKDVKFVIDSNVLQMEHSTKQAYMEPKYLEAIMAKEDSPK